MQNFCRINKIIFCYHFWKSFKKDSVRRLQFYDDSDICYSFWGGIIIDDLGQNNAEIFKKDIKWEE